MTTIQEPLSVTIRRDLPRLAEICHLRGHYALNAAKLTGLAKTRYHAAGLAFRVRLDALAWQSERATLIHRTLYPTTV